MYFYKLSFCICYFRARCLDKNLIWCGRGGSCLSNLDYSCRNNLGTYLAADELNKFDHFLKFIKPRMMTRGGRAVQRFQVCLEVLSEINPNKSSVWSLPAQRDTLGWGGGCTSYNRNVNSEDAFLEKLKSFGGLEAESGR